MSSERNQTIKTGGIIFVLMLVSSLGGAGLQTALQSDEPLYKCVDENKIRNCPNGIKADGLRCYYNETNPYSYDYCSSGWDKVDKNALLEELSSTKQTEKPHVVWGEQYRCNKDGCKKVVR